MPSHAPNVASGSGWSDCTIEYVAYASANSPTPRTPITARSAHPTPLFVRAAIVAPTTPKARVARTTVIMGTASTAPP